MNDGVLAEPTLDKTRQIRYWTRCLKTYLPHFYTSNDSNRMYLAFMIVSALDLLDAWNDITTQDERNGYIDWIYRCQHPKGGFRMWPGTDFGERSNDENAKWDPANVPATYFALSALLILGDDMKRVERRQTLNWLVQMQREDGSFGETLVEGRIEGGKDPRFGYCATGSRYILRGDSHGPLMIDGNKVQDIDIDALVRCVHTAESYDGGIADEAFHEPHAGYTFCALGCIKFVNRLNISSTKEGTHPMAPVDPASTIHWLVARQTDLVDPDAKIEDHTVNLMKPTESPAPHDEDNTATQVPLHQSPDKSTVVPPFDLVPPEAGMNGRTNKVADTCYAWWVGGSLDMLEQRKLLDQPALRRYLLTDTQHLVLGGFGKFPGDLPDLYHSYLGLATLGLMEQGDVKKVDGSMCVSRNASLRLPKLWETFA